MSLVCNRYNYRVDQTSRSSWESLQDIIDVKTESLLIAIKDLQKRVKILEAEVEHNKKMPDGRRFTKVMRDKK